MNITFLLMAQYGGKAIIPVEQACQDYFTHLSANKLIQKLSLGEIPIPLVRMEASQKCAKGIYLVDLANYLDGRIDAARKELDTMSR
ncbi:pyocin activator PrtN family protein [Bradyrhizobium yuanmingense]|uniref:pyocin activator PrtN family protein n=1 Tax=Bradyrhizobium yuanmingense TaxID=108015 RepID=UPI0023B8AF7D|nr:pyocin activator PrtN family protein [Bradyrhizobium yuanmingense]MDF0492737.1 pyocin activator PrtN family protein [Bradyrhizobium yuanmingense]